MRSAHEKSSDRTSSGSERASLQANELLHLDSLLELQQSAGNQAMLRLLGAGALQTKPKVSQSSDVNEQEADRIGAQVAGGTSGPRVQRKCAACAVGAPCSECADEERESPVQLKSAGGLTLQRSPAAGAEATPAASAGAQVETSPAPATAAPALIVEDDAKEVALGQMRKSDFLSQLRSAVCSAADDALSGTIWSAMGCPYIERWLDHYSKQPSSYVERALRKYAPETASARSAAEYIPIVTERVRRGIAEWSETGEVTDLPEEFAGGGLPGATVSGLVGGLLSGVGSAISGLVSGAGRALSSVGSMLFKHREGGEAEAEGDPEAIRGQLGSGQALENSVQRRMQSAFGADFAGVRVHTDTRARELSEGLNARAFTIGNDIAFGAEEYQPGTPVGDGLIAHELAHVVQQGGGSSATMALSKDEAAYSSLEEDADQSAVGAVVKLWSGATGGFGKIGKSAMPHLRSGLRLQGCSSTQKKTPESGTKEPVALTGDWKTDVENAKKVKDENTMVALVKQALGPTYNVRAAKKGSTDKVVAGDYEKLPAINFDIDLNQKKRPTGGAVGENPGLHFKDGKTGDQFAIIGPNALNPASSLIARMYADHELYLAEHALEGESGGRTSDDDELKAWTIDFTNYFHQYLSIGSGRPIWAPLLDYYAAASEPVKKDSISKLKKYYDNPVSDAKEAEKVKRAMSLWVQKWRAREGAKNRKKEPLSKELIDELDKFVKP